MRLACAAAAAAGGLAYANALHNPFIYDDYHTVVANPSIHNLANVGVVLLGAVTRPLVNVSYAVDRAIWGTAPFGFHLTGVLLHMLNVALFFAVVRQLASSGVSGSNPGMRAGATAGAASLLFAVHPMMSEAVGYISGRSEVLCATFFLAALLAGRCWLHEGGARWAVATIACWFAALASKEVAAMFPFVLFCWDRFAMPREAWQRRVRDVHAPLLAVAAAAAVIRLVVLVTVEYPQAQVHWEYILIDLDVMRRYVAMLALPRGQSMFHEVAPIAQAADLRLWIDLATLGSMTAIAWRCRRNAPEVSIGIAWFLLLLVPASALVLLDQGEPMTEHRVYLASCGLFIAASAAISRYAMRLGQSGRYAVGAVFTVAVAALCAQTLLRNRVFADPIRVWQEAVELAPAHYRPRVLLGEALEDRHRFDEALDQYELAVRMHPDDPIVYLKAGRLLAGAGRIDEARQTYARALTIDPANAVAKRSMRVLDTLDPTTSGGVR